VREKRPSRGLLETALAVEGLRDVEFQIGGFGTLVPQLERLCQRLRNTCYLGPVPPDDIAWLTLEADAVLMALDPANLNSRLSAPNKLFEAMCAGVPVITCRELLMGHFVTDEGIGATFAWGDWRALRRSARELRDSPAERSAMGRRGRALAESGFHWGAAAERLARLYDSVLKR
jgi:glycosyltransferase involved in cell wall biosynthesis